MGKKLVKKNGYNLLEKKNESHLKNGPKNDWRSSKKKKGENTFKKKVVEKMYES